MPAAPVEFVAELESLEVKADRPARVVINERTGTIVMGKEVRVSPVAIMHGNLTVEIQTVETVLPARPSLAGDHRGGAASQGERQGRKGSQPGAQAGRHGGGTGARARRHRIHAARRDRYSCRACTRPGRWKPTSM